MRSFAVALVIAACLAVHGRARSPVGPDISILLDRYSAGEFDAAASSAAGNPEETLRALDREAPAWIGSGSDTPRRRLIAAAFALETAGIVTLTPRRILYRDLLEWGCSRVKGEPPAEDTARWFVASVALAERMEDWSLLAQHLGHAKPWLAVEPRLRLAGAVVEENRTWELLSLLPESPGDGPLTALRDRYGALADVEAIAPESHLRRGAVELRLADRTMALQDFASVQRSTTDRDLLYLSHMFAGIAHVREHREAEAVRSYRAALALMPRAQSASALLTAALISLGDQDAAGAIADAVLSGTPAPDPWREYRTGDARLWAAHRARLREALR